MGGGGRASLLASTAPTMLAGIRVIRQPTLVYSSPVVVSTTRAPVVPRRSFCCTAASASTSSPLSLSRIPTDTTMKRLSTILNRRSSSKGTGASSASKSETASQPAGKGDKATSATATSKFSAPFLGAIDQGTTSTRFFIFDKSGAPVSQHQLEFNQYYEHSGWHEQDPQEILTSVTSCIKKASEHFLSLGHSPADIKGIGITNQRETTVVWDKTTGKALYNAIAWPDTRTGAIVRELKKRPGAECVQDICGLPLSTYPSSLKLVWLLRNVEAVKQAYEAGTLAFGTVDSWLLWNLNGGIKREGGEPVFVTDATNASRTMFADLATLEYSKEMLEFFQLDASKINLPRIVASAEPEAFGKLTGTGTKLDGTPITGLLGDQSAALVGQAGFQPGAAKNTYGTGCFLLKNVGPSPVHSSHGLLATVAYDFSKYSPHGGRDYALEGSIAVAGSGVKFLVKNFGFGGAAHEVTTMASKVKDNGGCVFVTAFSGLFAPYWIDDAKGTIFGITQHTEKGHLARATLEATCFQTRAILDAMELDSGKPLDELSVDGGMTNSDLCMQSQADILGIPVDRPAMRETTALGAAIAAGLAVGVYKSLDELKDINRHDRILFKPAISDKERETMYGSWKRAVQMCRGWLDVESPGEEGVAKEGSKEEEARVEKTTSAGTPL